ncbi:MAG: hypothetical protein H6828_04315 [Planctomycetes bacterium]|nr:hypothetical protein [Planctomycetota bacterium]
MAAPRSRLWLLGLALLAAHPWTPTRAGEAPPAPAEERVEHFVLEWRSDAPHPADRAQLPVALREAALAGEAGLVRLRAGSGERGPQLELEVDFPFDGIRLLSVEGLDPAGPKLVWRELSRGAGRTVFAEWTAADELRLLEWSSAGRQRDERLPCAGVELPHALLERARRGAVTEGEFRVVDPLALGVEARTVRTTYEDAPDGGAARRVVELRRADGTLAGRYVFQGEALVRFAWQEGGLVARRITPEAWAERRQRWGLDEDASPADASKIRESSPAGATPFGIRDGAAVY